MLLLFAALFTVEPITVRRIAVRAMERGSGVILLWFRNGKNVIFQFNFCLTNSEKM